MDGPRSLPALDVGIDIAAVTFTASWLLPGGKPSAPVTLAQDAAGDATVGSGCRRPALFRRRRES